MPVDLPVGQIQFPCKECLLEAAEVSPPSYQAANLGGNSDKQLFSLKTG